MKKVKVSKTDFLISDLPKNRKELFFDIIKNQWRILLLVALIVFVIFLPFILLRYYNLIIINELSNQKNNNDIFNAYVAYNLINFFVIYLMGILFGGVQRIYKKLCYNEGLFIGADFIKGIKENFKDFSVLFLIYGALYFLLEVLYMNYLIEGSSLYYLFKVVNYGIFLPLLVICLCLSAIYTDPILRKIKASCKIYFKYFPKIILVLLIGIFPLGLLFIGKTFVQLLIPMVYCLLYLPLFYVIVCLIMNNFFDKEINEKNFPNLYGKGMYNV